jgi:hypothetical protein
VPQYNQLLMRDTVDDTGVVPSPGYPYHSPDVICHAQVANPQTYFVDNYNLDPNQPVQLGEQVNFIYVPAKNLASTVQANWYIHVYRSTASLFMTPSIWKNAPLNTQSGNSYVTLGSLQPNQVGVGNTNFLLSGPTISAKCGGWHYESGVEISRLRSVLTRSIRRFRDKRKERTNSGLGRSAAVRRFSCEARSYWTSMRA